MPTRRWLAAMIAILWLWPGAAFGQSPSPELLDNYKRYHKLFAQGRYEEAMPFAEHAWKLGQQEYGPDHLSTATLLNDLGELYRALGRYNRGRAAARASADDSDEFPWVASPPSGLQPRKPGEALL